MLSFTGAPPRWSIGAPARYCSVRVESLAALWWPWIALDGFTLAETGGERTWPGLGGLPLEHKYQSVGLSAAQRRSGQTIIIALSNQEGSSQARVISSRLLSSETQVSSLILLPCDPQHFTLSMYQ